MTLIRQVSQHSKQNATIAVVKEQTQTTQRTIAVVNEQTNTTQ